MQYFTFSETPVLRRRKDGDKRLMYRIINQKERAIGTGSLHAGTYGGYVEHPELLDPTQDLWIDDKSCLFGNVSIDVTKGKSIRIQRVTIIDSKIKGSGTIGKSVTLNDEFDPRDIGMRGTPRFARLKDVRINAAHFEIGYGAHISRSTLLGKDIAILDMSDVSHSLLIDCTTGDHACIINCFVKDSVFWAESYATHSCLLHSEFLDASGVENVKASGLSLEGTQHVAKAYRFSLSTDEILKAAGLDDAPDREHNVVRRDVQLDGLLKKAQKKSDLFVETEDGQFEFLFTA